jgi:hypothetical protein
MGRQRVGEGRPQSNLQCFLDCTTPAVETHILPKVRSLLLMFLKGASAPGHELCRSVEFWSFQIVSQRRLVLGRRCSVFSPFSYCSSVY